MGDCGKDRCDRSSTSKFTWRSQCLSPNGWVNNNMKMIIMRLKVAFFRHQCKSSRNCGGQEQLIRTNLENRSDQSVP